MLVPISTRSPSVSVMRSTRSPLTKVPLVDPRSWIVTLSPLTMIFAWRRETMSSTSTMSRSLERPTMISEFAGRGNSPPWYFPEMKRIA